MRNIILLLLSIIVISCSTTNRMDWSNSYWATLETEEAYLYKSNSLTSIAEKEIKKGSILYFHSQVGDFKEVFTRHPRKVDKELRKNFRYYLYKPKYKKLTYKYSKSAATVYEIPFNPNHNYITGERGGCYYINKHSNKTYVNRDFCKSKSKSPLLLK